MPFISRGFLLAGTVFAVILNLHSAKTTVDLEIFGNIRENLIIANI